MADIIDPALEAQLAHDNLHNPEAIPAAEKSTVDTVLDRVSRFGNSLVSLLSGLLAACLILYSGYVLYDTFRTTTTAGNSWELLQYRPEIIDEGITPGAGAGSLASILPNYRAWLTVFDTNIDYPVMQHEENDLFYASHDVYGNVSLTGAIYLAHANSADFSDNYNILYGHHMDNFAMFGALDRYRTQSYFDSHKTGILVTNTGVFDLEVFAVADTDAYETRIYCPGNNMSSVVSFLKSPDAATTTVHILDETIADELLLDPEGRVVILSTCASADATNGRLIVAAKMTLRPLLTLELEDVEVVYDGTAHGPEDPALVNETYPEDPGDPKQFKLNYLDGLITYEYKLNGSSEWVTVDATHPFPTRTDVGTDTITVRATHPYYGSDTATMTLKVTPKTVTVKADPKSKTYNGGAGDPAFTATVTGTLGADTVSYTVTRPGAGTDENVGSYPGALVASGDEYQGNYRVVYESAAFTINKSPALTVSATDYEGTYDGQTHTLVAVPNVTEGTTVQYSTDGGTTWSSTPPSIRNYGTRDVMVRATNPNYEDASDTATMKVNRAAVTVKANDATKVYEAADPSFSATVTGIVDGYDLQYTITRPGAGTDENVRTYRDAIVASGAAIQGNYEVSYEPGDFEITRSNRLTLTVTDYAGVYDAAAHPLVVMANVPDGTTIEYSTDNGATWSTTVPSITDVGTQNVRIRATNPNFSTATATGTLRVTQKPVTVTVNNAAKVYGTADPAFTAQVTGVVDGFNIAYTVTRPRAGTDENVNTYPGAITATGQASQGNYSVTFVPGDFTITRARTLTVEFSGYDGFYDGQEHGITATALVDGQPAPAGTELWYQVDGGEWTQTPPSATDACEHSVLVRATNPNFFEVTDSTVLVIRRLPVTVTAKDLSKALDNNADTPELTRDSATIEGLLEGESPELITFTVRRDKAGTEEGETAGSHEGAIIVEGERIQGNYEVTFVAGKLTIINVPGGTTEGGTTPAPTTTANPNNPGGGNNNPGGNNDPGGNDNPGGGGGNRGEEEFLEDEDPPLVRFTRIFRPNGSSIAAGGNAWALVNLICVLVTVYLFLPLLHLKDKYGRARKMRRINDYKNELRALKRLKQKEELERARIEQQVYETAEAAGETLTAADITEERFAEAVEALYYQVHHFLRRFRAGIGVELIDTVLAIVAFILTEDMRAPMVLIDQWTPLMIILLGVCWIVDVRLVRYRGKSLAEEEEELRKQAEKAKAQTAASV